MTVYSCRELTPIYYGLSAPQLIILIIHKWWDVNDEQCKSPWMNLVVQLIMQENRRTLDAGLLFPFPTNSPFMLSPSFFCSSFFYSDFMYHHPHLSPFFLCFLCLFTFCLACISALQCLYHPPRLTFSPFSPPDALRSPSLFVSLWKR